MTDNLSQAFGALGNSHRLKNVRVLLEGQCCERRRNGQRLHCRVNIGNLRLLREVLETAERGGD